MKSILKRLCCLVIALSVCTGTVVFATDDATQPQISKKLSTAMYFLREMGIIGDYFDYNTDTAEKITRAEFSDVVVKALNRRSTGRTDTYFYDVPLSHYACDSINTLAELGFIHGVGENRFEPNSYMNIGAACKILLSIMGYEGLAVARGGYSKGYIDVAMDLELINYASGDSILTRGEMFLMVFEALRTPMYDIEGFKGNALELKVNEDKTILSEYHQAYFGKGVVDGVRTSSFNEVDLETNEVDIDGVVFTTRTQMDDMLGEEVEFIAYIDETDDSGEIVVANKTEKTDVIYISEKDFSRFNKDEYKLFYYDQNGRQKSIRIERDVKLIYNGGFIESNISDRINDGCDLKIIKNKDGYDRIVAKKKQDIVVKSVDVSGQIITNMADSPKALVLENRESVFLRKDGESNMTLDMLVPGNVLTVYESYTESMNEDGQFVEVYVSDNKVTGTIERVVSDDEETWITVNGVKYYDLSGLTYRPKNNVELYLDIDGDVAYAKFVSMRDFAAYLIEGKIVYEEEVFYDDVLSLEMLKQDGVIEKFKCTDKLKIDGKRIENATEAFNLLSNVSNSAIKPQLALIQINDDGFITNIDTIAGVQSEGTLRSTFEKESVMYKGVGYIGNNNTDIVAINSSTTVFRVPTEDMLKKGEATEDDYGIGAGGYIADNDWIIASSYRTTESKASAEEFLVVELNGQASATPWPILVDGVKYEYDTEEDEVYHVIEGYDGYAPVRIPVTTDATWKKKGTSWAEGDISLIESGMVVTCVKNSRNHATEVNLIYDPENREDYYTTGDYNGMINEIGIAEDASSDVIVVKIGVDGKSIANKADSAEIMVYDEDRQIRKGTFLDAKLYVDSYNQNDANTYSDVVVFQWQRWPRRAYIFRY